MTILALGRRAFLATSGAALLTGRAGRPAVAEPAALAADLEFLRLRYGLPGARTPSGSFAYNMVIK